MPAAPALGVLEQLLHDLDGQALLAFPVGLGLNYNFYKRTSNAPGFDVRRNFVGAYVTYEF